MKINEIHCISFLGCFKNLANIPTAHLNLDFMFSLEIFYVYLDFIKLTVEKLNSHMQVVPNILKSFPLLIN